MKVNQEGSTYRWYGGETFSLGQEKQRMDQKRLEKKMIFSDETHFEVHGIRSSVMRRSAGEPGRVGHVQQGLKPPPKKMFAVLSRHMDPDD